VRRELFRFLLVALLGVPPRTDAAGLEEFQGCVTLGLEMITDDLFVAANDEDNRLRLYSRLAQGMPIQTFELPSSSSSRKAMKEMDLEGAGRIGDRIYWISSHGANSKGKLSPARHRLLATQVIADSGIPRLQPVGRGYSRLLEDLLKVPALKFLNLAAAAGQPPKAPNALNIEGLAGTPEGHLLIGFRYPVPGGKALIVPLLNPAEAVAGVPARFGRLVLLDLGGLSIRSITGYGPGYLLVAGYDGRKALTCIFGTGLRPGRVSSHLLAWLRTLRPSP
jgi:hypothetical protein